MKTNQNQSVRNWVLWSVGVVLLVVFGTGCNTVRGFGRDVERTGEHIKAGAR
ncbi:MAG: entericidin A/B family lipoprotein [Verrucomicrobiota bacterium]